MLHRFLCSSRLLSVALVGTLASVGNLACAQEGPRHFSLQSGTETADLNCPPRSRTPAPRARSDEPLEPPDAEELDELGLLTQRLTPPAARPLAGDAAAPARASVPERIAIWGDSHLAAGSFPNELRRILAARGIKTRSTFIPLTMGRAGVILPLRRHCLDGGWKSELAYNARQPMVSTGIGMNALHGEQEAFLWLDLRNEAGEADISSVDLYFHALPEAGSISVSIDGGPEGKVVLGGSSPFGVVTISGSGPMSLLRIRVQQAPVVLHGLYLNHVERPAAVLDAFGIPGATMRSWQQVDPAHFREYFRGRQVDMIILEYGTNEGNARPFDASSYATMLSKALANMREVFPTAECVLVAPGDRGMLLPKSRKKAAATRKAEAHKGAKQEAKQGARHARQKPAKARAGVDLLHFSRIHESIYVLQRDIGAQYGCKAWSMQAAMGGQGSAYPWMMENPPLMARDLIHFTSRGYQRLAQELAGSLGWK